MTSRLAIESGLFLEELRTKAVPPARFAWQKEQRGIAERLLETQRLPSIEDEGWRFTPLAAMTQEAYALAPVQATNLLTADIGRFLLPEAEGARLVFVNGVFSPHLSSLSPLPHGVVFTSLGEAPQNSDEFLARHLGVLAPPSLDVFTALNTRMWHDGALIHVPAGVKLEKPLHVMFVTHAGKQPQMTSPRLLVVLGSGAQASFVEEYVCVEESVYFTNVVAEFRLGANAILEHTRVQSESRVGFQVANAVVHLGRDARYASQAIALGARTSRYNLKVVQTDTGTDAQVDGLALIAGHQEADTHTTLDHAKPYGRSSQLHKCVVADDAHAVFNGRIVVRSGAQQTDSAQASRNLLLSDRARVDTKPELEIFADDVKCAHGAAVGQIDAEELFYLKSRGLDEGAARDLLTYAFAAEVIDRVFVPSLRRQLRAVVLRQTERHKKGGA